jgi:ABC-type branched-subunit amino acid transport system permease subunit
MPAAQLDTSDPSSYSWKVISSLLQVPTLTRSRITTAYVAAVVTDGLQLLAGHLGWVAFDQALDVAAAVLMWRLLGFHPLLLPTFVVEFLPVTDLLPTWTGCVALVVALRKRQQRSIPEPTQGTVIDV